MGPAPALLAALRRMGKWLARVGFAGILATVPAAAEVTVRGDAHDLTVDADEATVADVIVAVAEAVGSTIEPPEDATEGMITGVYRGPIGDVLKALVPSADFFVAWRDGKVEVHFIAEGERPSVAEASPAGSADEEHEPSEGEAAEAPGEPADGDEPPAPARRIY